MAAAAAEALVELAAGRREATAPASRRRPRQRRRGALAGRAGAGDRGDVAGHRLGVRAGDELAWHRIGGVVDLVIDHLSDRAQPEVLRPRAGEGAVEVRADRPGRPGVRQLVAAAALRDEELLPLRDIPALGDPRLAGATAR